MSRTLEAIPRIHDLLLLRSAKLEAACIAEPPWVSHTLRRTPWVVVRRSLAPTGRLAVGARGEGREQRWGGLIEASQVALTKAPSQLRAALARESRRMLPAIKALTFVESLLADSKFDWGPAGSVGFELATGDPTTREGSDLDLVLFAPQRIDPLTARDLWLALTASPARIDLRVETPVCGFSLEEYTRPGLTRVLIRLPAGRRLVEDPWALIDERDTQ